MLLVICYYSFFVSRRRRFCPRFFLKYICLVNLFSYLGGGVGVGEMGVEKEGRRMRVAQRLRERWRERASERASERERARARARERERGERREGERENHKYRYILHTYIEPHIKHTA